jgi:hypothetical protein
MKWPPPLQRTAPGDELPTVSDDDLSADEYIQAALEDLPLWQREIQMREVTKGTWELTRSAEAIAEHSRELRTLTRWLIAISGILTLATVALIVVTIYGRG